MKIFERLSHILGVLIDPRYYYRRGIIDDQWSDSLEKKMDEKLRYQIYNSGSFGEFVDRNSASKDVLVGVSKWESYGCMGMNYRLRIIPRRRTAIRLKQYIKDYGVKGWVF